MVRIATYLKEAATASLALLLPARCPACDQAISRPRFFCELCSLSLVEVLAACQLCGMPGRAPCCCRCRRSPPPFASATSPWVYGGQLAIALRRCKYGREEHTGRALGGLLAAALALGQSSLDADAELVVPVPLHPRRLRVRGFNQAALLGSAVARLARLAYSPAVLSRWRDTPSQATLELAERRENVRGAFAARGSLLRGRQVLLVDDVMTSGATAAACTEALLEAGARRVDVLTLARVLP